jgi:hypothetical protein
MSIYEAWASGRPIFSRLPEVYQFQDPPIADWLTKFWDQLLINTKAKIDDIPVRQLNPATCDVEWLDFLAPLCGWDSKYWDKTWTVDAKRTLLINSYSGESIWENKGSAEVLSFVLATLGVRNIVQVQGDFILGTSVLGDELGSLPWEYTVRVPADYQGTSKDNLLQRIIKLFGPAWCIVNIIYDPDRFTFVNLLGINEDEILETETGTAIQTN